jgi:hypothetical protein
VCKPLFCALSKKNQEKKTQTRLALCLSIMSCIRDEGVNGSQPKYYTLQQRVLVSPILSGRYAYIHPSSATSFVPRVEQNIFDVLQSFFFVAAF